MTVNRKLVFQKSTILDVSQVLSSPLITINQFLLRTTKELYHRFLERWLLLPSQDFTCSKSTIETLKTLEHNVFRVKSKDTRLTSTTLFW